LFFATITEYLELGNLSVLEFLEVKPKIKVMAGLCFQNGISNTASSERRNSDPYTTEVEKSKEREPTLEIRFKKALNLSLKSSSS
jgi:hypothetical protein